MKKPPSDPRGVGREMLSPVGLQRKGGEPLPTTHGTLTRCLAREHSPASEASRWFVVSIGGCPLGFSRQVKITSR
jgi:hypothetical protein